MKRCAVVITLLLSQFAIAETDIFFFVREPDGSTNWQYIANYSSGLLIIALTYTVVRLFFSRRQSQRYNIELEEIRAQLEKRVNERTATLNLSLIHI